LSPLDDSSYLTMITLPLPTSLEDAISQREVDELSPFECFPKEIVWKIIEFVPESITELRLASRLLQSLVDEYERQRLTIPLVDELFFDEFYDAETDSIRRDKIRISVHVPLRKAALFEMRLKLRQPPNKLLERVKRQRLIAEQMAYQIEMHSQLANENDRACWEYLVDCMGTRLQQVTIFEHNEEGTQFPPVCALLEAFQFEKFFVAIRNLNNIAVIHLLKTIDAQKVEELEIVVHNVKASTPETILLDLSSRVRSLRIRQLYVTGPHQFFEHRNVEWAPIILSMFTGKMDKLIIENPYYPEYLSREGADLIREKLPLMDKKLWFATSFDQYPKGLSYKCKRYLVHVSKSRLQSHSRRFLSIKHIWRFRNETLDSFSF
ncbi:hypothetical protein PENTCL1PPCAC_5892, partial [Pristionchus entomophagus]